MAEPDDKEADEEQKPGRKPQARAQQEQEKVDAELADLRQTQEQLARDRQALGEEKLRLEQAWELFRQEQRDAGARATDDRPHRQRERRSASGKQQDSRGDGLREARNLLSSAAAGEVADVKGAIVDAIKLLDSYSARPKRRRRGRGRPHSIESETRALIKRLRFEQGMTHAAIADYLNDRGIRTPRGGLIWRSSSFHKWLKDEEHARGRQARPGRRAPGKDGGARAEHQEAARAAGK